jgi:uncharacterized LabA/DUF88 family protein
MIFVDGENFTLRGQEFAKATGLKLERGPYWQRDIFLWMPGVDAELPLYTDTEERMHNPPWFPGLAGDVPQPTAKDIRSERAHYFTAVTGDDALLMETRLALHQLNFQPEVFKKVKGSRSKGVDISLTTAMLSHAYQGNYEVAYLLAGDGDYVPLIEELRRLGRKVIIVFFASDGLNPALRIAGNRFIDIGDKFADRWNRLYKEREQNQESESRRAKAAARKVQAE